MSAAPTARAPSGRLVVLSAAGLDWPTLQTALTEARAPNLASLCAEGARGALTGHELPGGPAAWVTLATGQRPEVHRVGAADQPWAGGLRPAARPDWRAPAVWETLEAAGIATGVVAWPAARPADAWPGLHIDETYAEATGASAADWALPPHAVPTAAREDLRDRRVHPTGIAGAMLRPFVPDIATLDQAMDGRLPALAVRLARAATLQGAAVWMLGETDAQAIMLHQPWLAEVRAAFEADPDPRFAHVTPAAVRFLDDLIGRLRDLAEPTDTWIVLSPGRRETPGAIIAAGPGVPPGARLPATRLVDLAPSLLAHFGLRQDTLPGPSLAIFGAKPLAAAPSLPAPPGPPPPDPAILAALAAAGEPVPRPAAPRAQATRAAWLATAVVARNPDAALSLAKEALALDDANLAALRAGALAAFALGDAAQLTALAARLAEVAPQLGWSHLAWAAVARLQGDLARAAERLTAAAADPDPITRDAVAAAWLEIDRPAQAAALWRDLAARDPASGAAEMGLALCALARRDFREAEDRLTRVLRRTPYAAQPLSRLAEVYRQSGRRAEADRLDARARDLATEP